MSSSSCGVANCFVYSENLTLELWFESEPGIVIFTGKLLHPYLKVSVLLLLGA